MGTLMRQVKGLGGNTYDRLPEAAAVQVLPGDRA
jgi:6,7-dimethyl-8-ribityllumazine synthase